MSNFQHTITGNKYGEDLKVASKQTILPVIIETTGKMLGFFNIAMTTFAAGAVPATFTLPDGVVNIKCVTAPTRVDDGTGYGVEQYVAAIMTEHEGDINEAAGHASFIDQDSTGQYAIWFNPSQVRFLRESRGALFSSLLVNPASYGPGPAVPPTPPDVQDGTQQWVTNLNVSINDLGCAFFDFNWMETFKAVLDQKGLYGNVEPLTIEVITNPPDGSFKSMLVSGSGGQQSFSTGAVIFNTVRILRLKDVAPGNFTFVYKVTDTKGLSSTCTLTLTVTSV